MIGFKRKYRKMIICQINLKVMIHCCCCCCCCCYYYYYNYYYYYYYRLGWISRGLPKKLLQCFLRLD